MWNAPCALAAAQAARYIIYIILSFTGLPLLFLFEEAAHLAFAMGHAAFNGHWLQQQHSLCRMVCASFAQT